MTDGLESLTCRVMGMTCAACERRIEATLAGLHGVKTCCASYPKGIVAITFNPAQINRDAIGDALAELNYPIVNNDGKGLGSVTRWAVSVMVLSAIIFGFVLLERTGVFAMFPMADANTTLPMLFIIGLLTSVHCIAMCGGIAISQCAGAQADLSTQKLSKFMPGLLYNAGRVLSYTVVGGIVGVIGSVIAPSGGFKGIVAIAAAIFMLIMGLNLLGLFPFLSRLVPRMPRLVTKKVGGAKVGKGPLIVGLLNGFMPCGPLQAMQLYALSTGSLIMGAASMLLFSLGTVPLMLGLGALSALLSAKFTGVMMKVSAVLVVLLGLMMLNTGLSLSGFSPLF